MIRCVHYAGWVATLALTEAGSYEISGGHDVDGVEPDYVLRYADWTGVETAWFTVLEDLRTLLHDEHEGELTEAVAALIESPS